MFCQLRKSKITARNMTNNVKDVCYQSLSIQLSIHTKIIIFSNRLKQVIAI